MRKLNCFPSPALLPGALSLITAFSLITALSAIGTAPAAAARKKAAHPVHAAKKAVPAQAAASSASWKPAAALAAQLGPVTTQYGFQIRIPQSFSQTGNEFDRSSTLRQMAWSPDTVEKPTLEKSALGVLRLLIGPSFQSRTPEEAVSRFQMVLLEPKLNDFTQGDLEDGELAGVPFARMYWKGEQKKNPGVILHGFTYATVTDNTLYVLSCDDTDARYKHSLPLAEAAAETFRVLSSAEADAAVPLPELGTPQRLEPGVLLYDVPITRGRISTKLWIYLPEHPAAKKVPCLFIAPAGTHLFDGAALSEGDRLEHLPYVRAGFAVVAYELDGGIPEHPTREQVDMAAMVFLNAEGGQADARLAIRYALARVPQIDPNRLYTAGHSSAATVSLLVAEHDPRIKACIAYAPTTNVPGSLEAGTPGVIASLEEKVPGFTAFIQRASPDASASALRCPLFLFHAEDDTNTPISETLNFAQQVYPTNSQVTFVHVPTGDHYRSMIVDGIPDAIQWLQKLPAP